MEKPKKYNVYEEFLNTPKLQYSNTPQILEHVSVGSAHPKSGYSE